MGDGKESLADRILDWAPAAVLVLVTLMAVFHGCHIELSCVSKPSEAADDQ